MASPKPNPMKKEINKKALTALAIFGIPGLMVTLFEPFKALGDNIKPGVGDLMNGGIGLALFMLAVIAALVAKKRSSP